MYAYPALITLSSSFTPFLLKTIHTCLGEASASIDCVVKVYPLPRSQVSPTVMVLLYGSGVDVGVGAGVVAAGGGVGVKVDVVVGVGGGESVEVAVGEAR